MDTTVSSVGLDTLSIDSASLFRSCGLLMQVWWAVNSDSRSRVYAHNVARKATLELTNGGIQAAVLSLGADGSGHVWMGHQGGLVQVWCAACQCPICQWSGMCPADIR